MRQYVFRLLIDIFTFEVARIMKFEINKLMCILFVHLSSIIPEISKDLVLIIPEILELIELRSYKFCLV